MTSQNVVIHKQCPYCHKQVTVASRRDNIRAHLAECPVGAFAHAKNEATMACKPAVPLDQVVAVHSERVAPEYHRQNAVEYADAQTQCTSSLVVRGTQTDADTVIRCNAGTQVELQPIKGYVGAPLYMPSGNWRGVPIVTWQHEGLAATSTGERTHAHRCAFCGILYVHTHEVGKSLEEFSKYPQVCKRCEVRANQSTIHHRRLVFESDAPPGQDEVD